MDWNKELDRVDALVMELCGHCDCNRLPIQCGYCRSQQRIESRRKERQKDCHHCGEPATEARGGYVRHEGVDEYDSIDLCSNCAADHDKREDQLRYENAYL